MSSFCNTRRKGLLGS